MQRGVLRVISPSRVRRWTSVEAAAAARPCGVAIWFHRAALSFWGAWANAPRGFPRIPVRMFRSKRPCWQGNLRAPVFPCSLRRRSTVLCFCASCVGRACSDVRISRCILCAGKRGHEHAICAPPPAA